MNTPPKSFNRCVWSSALMLCSLFVAPHWALAAPPSNALVKKEQQAAETLAQLADLQRQAQANIAAANVVTTVGQISQRQLDAYQAINLRLQAALQQANACLPELRAPVAAMANANTTVRQAVSQSHGAVRAIAQSGGAALASVAQAADAAFAQRDAAELERGRAHEALQKQARLCAELARSAQWAYTNSETAALRGVGQARRLIEVRQTLQSQWQATQSVFKTAAQTGLLTALQPAPVPSADTQVNDLARALEQSPRWANAPSQGSVSAASKAELESPAPLWSQWSRLQDAAAYLDTQLAASDCPPAACNVFSTERQNLTQRMVESQTRLDRLNGQWQQTPNTLNRSLEETSAQQLALIGAVNALATALAPAITQTQAEAQAVASAGLPLLKAAEAAHAKAEQEWQAAYRLAYGQAPDMQTHPSAAGASAMPAPSPRPAMAAITDIRDHAFEMFSELDGEISGFGSYTYVMVRSAVDMESAPVRSRFVRLLATLQALPDATLVPKDLAQHINVFCVPVLPGHEAARRPDNVAYASDLGQQLKMRAQNGLLTQSSVRHRLNNSPGPFLITLPTRLSKAQSSTPVLIADLSAYPEDAIADLASHYMNGLVDDFPRQQALWKPPVLQRVALFMIHMAEGTGELITSAMPTAQAATPQR